MSYNATANAVIGDFSRRTSRILSPRRLFLLFLVPPLLVRHLAKASRETARIHLDVLEYRAILGRASDEAWVFDPDLALVDQFEKLKASALRMRASALRIATSSRIHQRLRNSERAALDLVQICAELYDTLCAIQEDILEHDADHALKVQDMAANSPEELDALLARIASTS
ncbi:hypothetical protein [Thiomonas sp. X19]|uniref:hypothetical protein n=1 Tax=Thiomonas sp. X19 TaxID=1050370 RepID=UPI001E2CBABB|nr:hypothetical protein [Thiomonas sp. X19]